MANRKRELLPVRYQHLVFTLPHESNDFYRYNPTFCYDLLFRAAWQTLDTFARDPKWLGLGARRCQLGSNHRIIDLDGGKVAFHGVVA